MATAYFYTLTKRRNSTLQPTGGTSLDVNLKSGTSFISPTFLLSLGSTPTYNYVSYEGRYYFITDIVSVRNDLWEIQCDVDVLATYKADILASTQFVAYSSVSGGTWLADTRIPVMKNATVAASSSAIGILDVDGMYVLCVVGKESAAAYECSLTNIKDVLAAISTWETTGITNAVSHINPISGSTADFGDAITMLNDTLAGIAEALVNTGFVGNAYADAPNCVRSCIWVPFGYALHDGQSDIWLGNFNSHVNCKRISTKPTTGSSSVSIPWQYSDWRRSVCEEVYLYLPLVGMVNLSSDELVNASSITINWSATATDGCICYELKAGSQIIGSYGGNCAANYPIGISQQASAGEIAQQIISTGEKMLSTAITAGSSINPAAWYGGALSLGAEANVGIYNATNAAMTRHNSCIGGIGGGAGSGLDLNATCYTVAHPTVVSPSDMMATMGVPTQKPMALSTCTGYCECANAHVSLDATATEMNMVDSYLNSGFYIE